MYTTSFVDVPLEELLTRVQTLKHEGMRFVQMCAETTEQGIDLLYTFYDETREHALNLCVYGIDAESRVPSIQGLYFAAFSYENETHDLYGVRFINMKLDFGGHFFNVATSEPMTIITPEIKAEREKLAKKKALAEAAAKKAREEAEAAQAERALHTSGAEADSAAVAAVNAAAPAGDAAPTDSGSAAGAAKAAGSPASASAQAKAAPAPKPAMTAEERAAKMEAKLAAMDPEKAAKVRAALAAKAAKDAAAGKDGE